VPTTVDGQTIRVLKTAVANAQLGRPWEAGDPGKHLTSAGPARIPFGAQDPLRASDGRNYLPGLLRSTPGIRPVVFPRNPKAQAEFCARLTVAITTPQCLR
jgi:hypothetical protein